MGRGAKSCAVLPGHSLAESWSGVGPGARAALPYARSTPISTALLLSLRPSPLHSPFARSSGLGASADGGASLIGVGGPELRECGRVVRLPGPYCSARELES